MHASPAPIVFERSRVSITVAFAAFALLTALLLSPGLITGPSLDAAVFAGVADQLRRGDLLYVEAWDHKPPAAYVLFALGQSVQPWMSAWMVSWLISVLATAGTGLGLAYALATMGVRRWAAYVAAGIAVAFMAQYLTALGGGLTEPLAALPAGWALALTLSHRQTLPWRLGAGLLLGIALLTSLQLAPAIVGIAGLAVVAATRRDRWRVIRDLAGGAAIPWLLSGIAFLATGTLGAAIDAVFGYGAAYRTASSAFGAELSRAPAAWTVLSALVLVTCAALGGLALWRAGPTRRGVLYAVAAWIAVALALFVFQGRFIAHYAIPLAIPLGILAGAGLEATAVRWQRATSPARFALALAFALALVASAIAGFLGGRYELTGNEELSHQVGTAADYVKDHSEPDDTILVWGNRPELYLAAERGSAIPFRFLYPLTTEGYVTPDLVERVRSELSEDPPLLIVDAGSAEPGAPGFLPLLIDRPVVREGREMDILEPLRTFIRANYDLLGESHGWPIYRLQAAGDTGDE
jgi:hypothetical protein